jgi:hypothetical protein
MANAIDAGRRLTPPYGKSRHRGQMRQRDCSNAWFVAALKRSNPVSGSTDRIAAA